MRVIFIQGLFAATAYARLVSVDQLYKQAVLKDFALIPVAAGEASADQVCQLIEKFWEQHDTLVVISSDLSHFLDYQAAQKLDRKTSVMIEKLQYKRLENNSACGRIPLSGLMKLA